MRVGIDYLPAVCHAPGVGRYARELVRALVRLPEAPELALFEVGGGERVMEGRLGLEGARVERRRSRAPRRLVTALHRLTGRGAEHWLGGVDLFHRALPGYPPVAAAPEVLPVAELPPPGSPADETLAAALERCAAALVFCSHYASELPARYGIDATRVHRVHVGCEHWSRESTSRPSESPAPPTVPRILVLGALRRERMPCAVLAGFEELRAAGRPAELLFVGHPGSASADFEAALARSPVRGDVRWIASPVEADMPGLVAGAAALVHLAAEEGTPVTPLEAFAAGVPVVASPLPAFVEALGERARWVEADEPRTLAAALGQTLDERGEERQQAREARLELAAGYTWARNARETVSIWSSVLEARG